MNNIDFESILLKKHHYWRNLLIILFIAMVVTGVWWVQSEQASETAPAPEPTVNPLCVEFSSVEGEVTCEDAIKIALAEYLGEVYSVNKTQIPTKEMTEKDVWLIGTNLEKPIEMPKRPNQNESEYTTIVEIAVERYTGEVKVYKMVGA